MLSLLCPISGMIGFHDQRLLNIRMLSLNELFRRSLFCGGAVDFGPWNLFNPDSISLRRIETGLMCTSQGHCKN